MERRTQAGVSALQGLDGVEAINDFGQIQELRLRRDCDPQQVLGVILGRTRVWSFEVAKPSLHDIFVRIASPEPEEMQPGGSVGGVADSAFTASPTPAADKVQHA